MDYIHEAETLRNNNPEWSTDNNNALQKIMVEVVRVGKGVWLVRPDKDERFYGYTPSVVDNLMFFSAGGYAGGLFIEGDLARFICELTSEGKRLPATA